MEFTRKLKEMESAPPDPIMQPSPVESGFDETDSISSPFSPTPNNNNQSNHSPQIGNLSEKTDPPKDEEVMRRSTSRSKFRLQRDSVFDHGDNFVPQLMGSDKLGGMVNDRLVREALYKIHAEMMAESAVTIYGSDPKGVATLFEKRPEWLRFEVSVDSFNLCDVP